MVHMLAMVLIYIHDARLYAVMFMEAIHNPHKQRPRPAKARRDRATACPFPISISQALLIPIPTDSGSGAMRVTSPEARRRFITEFTE
jgi:hypothetical protein